MSQETPVKPTPIQPVTFTPLLELEQKYEGLAETIVRIISLPEVDGGSRVKIIAAKPALVHFTVKFEGTKRGNLSYNSGTGGNLHGQYEKTNMP